MWRSTIHEDLMMPTQSGRKLLYLGEEGIILYELGCIHVAVNV